MAIAKLTVTTQDGSVFTGEHNTKDTIDQSVAKLIPAELLVRDCRPRTLTIELTFPERRKGERRKAPER